MKMHSWLRLSLTALMLVVLAACGGGGEQAGTTDDTVDNTTTENGEAASGAAGDFPVYPGAEPPASGSSLEQSINMMEQQFAQQQSFNADAEGYVLPDGTTFGEVEDFYNEELTALGWSRPAGMADALSNTLPGGGAAFWIQGEDDVFSIFVAEDPESGETFLIAVRGTQ